MKTGVQVLAERLVAVGADYSLIVAVGDAFGHATGALLDEMRRARMSPTTKGPSRGPLPIRPRCRSRPGGPGREARASR